MIHRARRSCIDCSGVQACVARIASRHASTTSAIKSGLRAEVAGRRAGRSRFAASKSDEYSAQRQARRPERSFENGRSRITTRSSEDDEWRREKSTFHAARVPTSKQSSDYDRKARDSKYDGLTRSTPGRTARLSPELQWRKEEDDGFRNRRQRRKAWFEGHQENIQARQPAEDLELDVRDNGRQSQSSSKRPSMDKAMDGDEWSPPRRHRSEPVSHTNTRSNAESPMARAKSSSTYDEDIPPPIHYTTASSQFVYGANVVLAALRSHARKIYKLYMHKRAEAENIAEIRRSASHLGVEIVRTTDTNLLNTLSDGRPHNGVVLEVSPIAARPVKHLGPYYSNNASFKLALHDQSAEDAAVNGTETMMRGLTNRKPLILFLDGITDPGNVGNIIRSAHFFGVDAVAIATLTCASLASPVVAKASAGACEAIPIFAVPQASGFVFSSRKNGWTICAAVAPEDIRSNAPPGSAKHLTAQQISSSALADEPTILVLGAEGQGLRESLFKKANVLVTIERGLTTGKSLDAGVDSLNVATAAAVLLDAFVLGQRSNSRNSTSATGGVPSEVSTTEQGRSDLEERGNNAEEADEPHTKQAVGN